MTVVTTEATTPHQNYSGLSALASINLAVPHVLSSSETSSLHSTSRPRTRSSSVNTDARISSEEARKGSTIVSPPRKSVGQLPSPTVSNNSNSSGGRSISKSQSIENGIGSTSSARATLVPLSNQTTRDSMEATGPDAMLGDRAFMSMSDFGDYDGIINQLGTGYAVASSKRNAEFHSLFKSIPDDDYLIEGTLAQVIHELMANVSYKWHCTDYGCALQREILIQGRIYISEHHLSFNANIFGWVTTVSHFSLIGGMVRN